MHPRLCCRQAPHRAHHVAPLALSAPLRVAHDKPCHCNAPRPPTHQSFTVHHEQSFKQDAPHRI